MSLILTLNTFHKWVRKDIIPHMQIISKWPDMYGIHKGRFLRCYPYGMQDCENLLNLPKFSELTDHINCLEEKSVACYNSKYTAYLSCV